MLDNNGTNISNRDNDALFNTCRDRYKSRLVYIRFYKHRRELVPDVARHEYSPKLK